MIRKHLRFKRLVLGLAFGVAVAAFSAPTVQAKPTSGHGSLNPLAHSLIHRSTHASVTAAGHVGCGAVITQDTKLDSDLVNCPGDGVVIGADKITLDLAGHTIDGLGSAAPFGSTGIDNSGGFDNVVIENGAVTEFQEGIALVGTVGNVARRLSVSRNVSDGFFVDGFAAGDSSGNRLVDNRVFDNVGGVGGGIHLRGSDENVIRRNEATGNGGAGLFLTFSSERNDVDGNVLSGNHAQGVFVLERADENELKRNVIAGNGLTGILIAGSNRNEIVGNEISGNAGGGIAIVGDAPSPSNENMLASNGVTSNAGDGIFVYGPSEFMGQLIPGATGTMVLANAADKNADDGIDVRSAATTVTRNSANRNIDLGIDAVPGIVDGGGNRAQENGNPLQCVNVVCS